MILKCRGCFGYNLESVVSLGFVPLANALLTKEQLSEPEEKYPLDLVFCQDCKLVQIVETVPAEKLFKQYVYMSSISKTMLESARMLVEDVIQENKLAPDHGTVLEIGSNDGYLLQNYVKAGIKAIGIEPAENIAQMAREKGVHTITGFFNLDRAKELTRSGFKADVVHANNVLAHVEDLHGVVAGIGEILKDDGVAIVETHYVKNLVEENQFDCIYHEHLCYYSATSLNNLFNRHGMDLVKVEWIPVHGGSLRAYFQKGFRGSGGIEFLLKEMMDGIWEADYYKSIGSKIQALRENLNSVLNERLNKNVALYGVSAKSTTLLNVLGIGRFIDFALDATPTKIGKFTPGTHLPIYSTDVINELKPDVCLLGTWNFVDEIVEKEKEYADNGGKFILPIPVLEEF